MSWSSVWTGLDLLIRYLQLISPVKEPSCLLNFKITLSWDKLKAIVFVIYGKDSTRLHSTSNNDNSHVPNGTPHDSCPVMGGFMIGE